MNSVTNATKAVDGLSQLPFLKQLGAMVGIAASVAIGVAVILWSKEPNYQAIFTHLDSLDKSRAMEILKQDQIDVKIDPASGFILVPNGKVDEAKLKLAGAGLSTSHSVGFELLEKNNDLGTSQFMEMTRYKRALEGELARTIASISSVRRARVHLAIPKDSAFLREKTKSSATVFLDLFAGKRLQQEQVSAISHLVASSVPGLIMDDVTIVDHKGNLLTSGDGFEGKITREFNYTRQLEEHYRNRILKLLEPMIGYGNVRAEVSADVDFTQFEQTQEQYGSDFPAVRKEYTKETSADPSLSGGVPGANANQGGESFDDPQTGERKNANIEIVKNYELDKTISHTQKKSGRLKRLSIAVVVNDKVNKDAAGQIKREPRTEEEINKITSLIKDSVGFSITRGDTINVINSPFVVPEEIEQLPEAAIWEEDWFWDIVKQTSAGLFLLVILIFVIRPFFKSMAEVGAQRVVSLPSPDEQEAQDGQQNTPQPVQNTPAPPPMPTPQLNSYNGHLDVAKNIVTEEPARVAQVVRSWMDQS